MTMQLAERTVLDASSDCGAYAWEGWANGLRARTVVADPDLQLFIEGAVRNVEGVGAVLVARLVDAEGRVYALQTSGWGF